jgi:hypothetical protein
VQVVATVRDGTTQAPAAIIGSFQTLPWRWA